MLKRVEIEDARMASECNGDADGNGSTAAYVSLSMNMQTECRDCDVI